MTRSDADIERAVIVSLTQYAGDFDVEAIVHAIIRGYGLVDIEFIDSDEYWSIVARARNT